jgi:hypothetical protein
MRDHRAYNSITRGSFYLCLRWTRVWIANCPNLENLNEVKITMDHLLLDLEIDAACWEFLAHRIVACGGEKPPQPIVLVMDAAPREDEDGWDELTAKAARLGAGPETVGEMTERMLARMEE